MALLGLNEENEDWFWYCCRCCPVKVLLEIPALEDGLVAVIVLSDGLPRLAALFVVLLVGATFCAVVVIIVLFLLYVGIIA